MFTHFHGAFPAATCDQPGKAYTAEIVGAIDTSEVSIMNGLSVNLHLFLMAFYRPERSGRYKIMFEKQAFPSDRVSSDIPFNSINDPLYPWMFKFCTTG